MSQPIDLIPLEHRVRQRLKRRLLVWAAVALCCFLANFVAGLCLKWRAMRLEAALAPMRRNVMATRSWEEMISPLLLRLQDARKQRVVVNELLSEPSWSGLLSHLAGAAEDGLRITCVEVTRRPPPSPGKEQGEQSAGIATLAVQGLARSNSAVMRFLKRLPESPSISKIELDKAETQRMDGGVSLVSFAVNGVVE